MSAGGAFAKMRGDGLEDDPLTSFIKGETMRFLPCAAVLAALFGLTLVGCKSAEETAAEKKAVQEELDQLQGKWRIASRGGEVDPEGEDDKDRDKGLVITIDKDIMTYAYDGVADSYRRMTIRPNKDPKEVDFVYVDDKGKEITTTKSTRKKGKTKTTKTSIKEQAVYKLEGDKLTLNIAWGDKSRPTDFTSPPGSNRYTLTLQKIKGTDKPSEEKNDAKEVKNAKDGKGGDKDAKSEDKDPQ